MNPKCNASECDQDIAFLMSHATNRKLSSELYYCKTHGEAYLKEYRSKFSSGGMIADSSKSVLCDVSLVSINYDHQQQSLVFLEAAGEVDFFEFFTGTVASSAIRHYLNQSRPKDRPLTHEAMKNAIESLGGRIEGATIHTYDDSRHFFKAKLGIKNGGDSIDLDVRPSDAISIACLCSVPIEVSRHLMSKQFRGIVRT